jgi:hypothetical protein
MSPSLIPSTSYSLHQSTVPRFIPKNYRLRMSNIASLLLYEYTSYKLWCILQLHLGLNGFWLDDLSTCPISGRWKHALWVSNGSSRDINGGWYFNTQLLFYTRLTDILEDLLMIKVTGGVLAATWLGCMLTIFCECRPIYLAWQVLPKAPQCAVRCYRTQKTIEPS